jgi:hypothetical protein
MGLGSICRFDSVKLTSVANVTGKKILFGDYIFNTLPVAPYKNY